MRASENPFAVQRIHALPFQFEGTESLESVQQRFWDQVEQGQRRQGLLGQHGSGKSTLLRELGQYWQARNLDVVWLNGANLRFGLAGQRAKRPLLDSRQRVLLIDSAERLSAWDWVRIRWRFGRLPILQTAHSADRTPVLYHCRSTYGLFEELCRELLGGRWMEFNSTFPAADRRQIFVEHGGDIRQCFFDLFDRLAQGTGPFGQSTRIIEPPGPRVIDVSEA
ncbi:MAG: ATP-binding protein [Pirellulaceae bacterium]|nr:ATP-binding protein [Pirellulaceae bacterium]